MDYNLNWSATCCSWVTLTGSGVNKSNDTLYTGSGSIAGIIVSASPAASAGDETTCTVRFVSEASEGVPQHTATLTVKRCPYGCSCDDYEINEVITDNISNTGVTNASYYTVKQNNGCGGLTVSSDAQWLTATITGNSCVLTATKNDGIPRQANVKFLINNTTVCTAYTVTQEGRDCDCRDISITQTGITVGCSGKDVEENAISNNCSGVLTKTLSATTNVDWIKNLTISGTKVKFNVGERDDANAYTTSRTGTITVTYDGQSCAGKTIQVTQGTCGCSCDQLVPEGSGTYNAACEGFSGNVNASIFKVTSQCSTKPEIREIRKGAFKGSATNEISASLNTDGTVYLKIPKNETDAERVYYVIFKMGDANTCDDKEVNALKIVQATGCNGGKCSDITVTTSDQTWGSGDTGSSTAKTIATLSGDKLDGWSLSATNVPTWITTGKSGNNITAYPNGTCTTGCTNREAEITIETSYSKNGTTNSCESKKVKVTQQCFREIRIVATPDSLTCSGGTVTFSIEDVNS